MRKINPRKFQLATRATPREINRKILLNLVREHQPISRADLARRMKTSRAAITQLVNELLEEESIYEGGYAHVPRGRRPKMLYVRTEDRLAVAVDVRFSRTYLMLSDFGGRTLAQERFPTVADPEALADQLAERIRDLLHANAAQGRCEGIGLVVPGMVDRRTGRILNSPALGWRNVDLREMLASRVGIRVFIENAPVAAALAHMWLSPAGGERVDNFAYVTVSDGVGVGVVMDGEVLRGYGDVAGEFGHLPLDLNGPQCLCGLRGCLQAYVSNLATRGRYLGLDPAVPGDREELRHHPLRITDLVASARSGDERAGETLHETARMLGLGLAGIVMALNPARIFVDGDVVAGWDLLGPVVLEAMRGRALTERGAATPVVPVSAGHRARLRGATAILLARNFAAPEVA